MENLSIPHLSTLCLLSLVQHCVINGEYCTCYFCQHCVVVNQRCHRIASFLRLVLTKISGTLFTIIYAMLYQIFACCNSCRNDILAPTSPFFTKHATGYQTPKEQKIDRCFLCTYKHHLRKITIFSYYIFFLSCLSNQQQYFSSCAVDTSRIIQPHS